MKRASLTCLFLCFTAPLIVAQSNAGPVINRSAAARFGNAVSLNAGPLFAPAQDFALTGVGPNTSAVGDLNGDGKPDLVVALQGYAGNEGVIDVFLGNGDGTFTLAEWYASGADWANSVQLADLNGDGKLDMVVSNCGTDVNSCPSETDGVVAVFLGNGDGTFQGPTLYDAGASGATKVLVTDLNMDGKLDLLVQVGGGFGVMFGNGDGTFQPVAVTTAGCVSLAVGDLNGDGIPDLLCGSNALVNILLGNGDGTFMLSGSIPLGGLETDAVAADLDGDGKLDIVTLTYNPDITAHFVGVLKGNGDGTFQPQHRYPKLATFGVHLVIADLNADGAPDVVVTGFHWGPGDDGQLEVLLGKGNTKLGRPVLYEAGGEGSFSVTVADLNGDGRLDLIASDLFSDNLGILFNIGHYPTSALLTSSLNPSTQGEAVTFTATVRSGGVAAPDGEIVTFKGTKALGKGTLSGGTATFTTSKLNVGTTAITAIYRGDSNFRPCTSNTVEQVVNQK